jgi:hypothetical protein
MKKYFRNFFNDPNVVAILEAVAIAIFAFALAWLLHFIYNL